MHADAGPQTSPFPQEPESESVLTWCASPLTALPPPNPARASVEVRPAPRRVGTGAAWTVVLVSCWELAFGASAGRGAERGGFALVRGVVAPGFLAVLLVGFLGFSLRGRVLSH